MQEKALWDKYHNNLLNKGLSNRRIKKLESLYRIIQRGINGKLETAQRNEIEDFITRLNKDEFIKEDNTHYSGWSKSDIKKFVKAFYRWLRANDEIYPPEVAWIKTKIRKDEQPEEKEILTHEEAKELANAFNKAEYKYAVLFLFDTGFRIGELLSVTRADVTFEPYDADEKCFWVNCRESKTTTRKVPLLLYTEDYRDFMNSTYVSTLEPKDKLFSFNYAAFLKSLKRYSKKVLGKQISPHHLRHSSATFYAAEFDGDMRLLADRYGWTYSSDQLRTYIRKSGAYQKKGAKKVYSNEVHKLRNEVQTMQEQIEQMTKVIAEQIDNKVKQRMEHNI